MAPSRPRKAAKEKVTPADRLLGRRRSPWASGSFGSPEETRAQVDKNGILAPRVRRFTWG
jgi:hypothetical protein